MNFVALLALIYFGLLVLLGFRTGEAALFGLVLAALIGLLGVVERRPKR